MKFRFRRENGRRRIDGALHRGNELAENREGTRVANAAHSRDTEIAIHAGAKWHSPGHFRRAKVRAFDTIRDR